MLLLLFRAIRFAQELPEGFLAIALLLGPDLPGISPRTCMQMIGTSHHSIWIALSCKERHNTCTMKDRRGHPNSVFARAVTLVKPPVVQTGILELQRPRCLKIGSQRLNRRRWKMMSRTTLHPHLHGALEGPELHRICSWLQSSDFWNARSCKKRRVRTGYI